MIYRHPHSIDRFKDKEKEQKYSEENLVKKWYMASPSLLITLLFFYYKLHTNDKYKTKSHCILIFVLSYCNIYNKKNHQWVIILLLIIIIYRKILFIVHSLSNFKNIFELLYIYQKIRVPSLDYLKFDVIFDLHSNVNL